MQFERTLNPNQYEQLVKAFIDYSNNNGCYKSYRDTLFEIFNGADAATNVMGMMLSVKAEHQSQFDEDIRKKFDE